MPPRRGGRPLHPIYPHARLVLGHVADPESALRNVVQAVRPGGWVLIEDVDFLWTDVGAQPLHPERQMAPYFRVWTATVHFMREHGYAVHWGAGWPGRCATRDSKTYAGKP